MGALTTGTLLFGEFADLGHLQNRKLPLGCSFYDILWPQKQFWGKLIKQDSSRTP